MADESEAAKSAAMHDAARAGAISGLDTLDALRAQHL
jgi:predicted dinucleotide-utilizing enzyme